MSRHRITLIPKQQNSAGCTPRNQTCLPKFSMLLMGLVTFGMGLLNVPGIVMSIFVGALPIPAIAAPIELRRFTQRRRA